MLLQCATPDAVARLPCTQLAQQADNLWATYFTTQEHSSLTAFLRNVLTMEERHRDKGTLIQVGLLSAMSARFGAVRRQIKGQMLSNLSTLPGTSLLVLFFFWGGGGG